MKNATCIIIIGILFTPGFLLAQETVEITWDLGTQYSYRTFHSTNALEAKLKYTADLGGNPEIQTKLYVALEAFGTVYFVPCFTVLPCNYDKTLRTSTGTWNILSGQIGPITTEVTIKLYAALFDTSMNLISNVAQTEIRIDNRSVSDMQTIQPGTFKMGSPEDESCRVGNESDHNVTITQAFEIQINEVTQDMWNTIFPNYWPAAFAAECGGNCPVERVTWYDAVVFCNRLSQQAGYRPCYYTDSSYTSVFDVELPVFGGEVYWDRSANGYRLPTEAEWEYAARAGMNTAFSVEASDYTDNACLCQKTQVQSFTWYCGNAMNKTHEVGLLRANAWGLYDMHGNVHEWVWDWSGDYGSRDDTDPVGPDEGPAKIQRGGSWRSFSSECRSASRGSDFPQYIDYRNGFRLARTP